MSGLIRSEFTELKKYPKYFINTRGDVISAVRPTYRILKVRYDGCGYKRYCLHGKDTSIHRLLAQTYLKDFKDNLHVNHIDANIWNNSLDNLEMVTHAENMKHASRLGRMGNYCGEKCHLTKISKEDVIEIRQLWTTGLYKQEEIANKFNCKKNNISEIVRYKSWKNI